MSGFKVQSQPCSTCIYSKNTPVRRSIAALERELGKDSIGNFLGWRTCHHSDDVCCRGFWNRHKNHFNLGRIIQRLGGPEFVEVDTLK